MSLSIDPAHDADDIVHPAAVPFVIVHLACFAAIWTGVSATSLWLAFGLYWLRMFGVTAGYHRYFSHRSYATSRAFQFVLALLAQSSAQKSVLWWAAKHRHHHMFSDTEHDVHSPRHTGFVYSHVGWIFARKHDEADLARVQDWTKYPELMWLHRYELVPAVLLGVICFLVDGWTGVVVGFCWSTVAVWHGTFCINSLAHVHGDKRYVTGDDSRNNWWLAVITMGEGWHNNHHAYQSSVRQGFRWYEFDPTFYILKGLSRAGIVRDMKSPPEAVIRNEQRLGSRVIERAAADLAAAFDVDAIAQAIRAAMPSTPGLADLAAGLAGAQHKAAELIEHFPIRLPHLPTRDDLRSRATAMFARTPSLDEIVDRAHGKLLEAVGARLAATT